MRQTLRALDAVRAQHEAERARARVRGELARLPPPNVPLYWTSPGVARCGMPSPAALRAREAARAAALVACASLDSENEGALVCVAAARPRPDPGPVAYVLALGVCVCRELDAEAGVWRECGAHVPEMGVHACADAAYVPRREGFTPHAATAARPARCPPGVGITRTCARHTELAQLTRANFAGTYTDATGASRPCARARTARSTCAAPSPARTAGAGQAPRRRAARAATTSAATTCAKPRARRRTLLLLCARRRAASSAQVARRTAPRAG